MVSPGGLRSGILGGSPDAARSSPERAKPGRGGPELGPSGASLLRQASGQAPRGDPDVTEPDPPRALADLRLMHAGA